LPTTLVPSMKDGRGLPAALLVLGQFAELSHDPLSRPAFGALRFDQGKVDVPLAILGSLIASKVHPRLPAT